MNAPFVIGRIFFFVSFNGLSFGIFSFFVLFQVARVWAELRFPLLPLEPLL
jgi:hypothetical protein